MGMYNEVFCTCPRCGMAACAQIHQIVLGFGGFDIDSWNATLEELTPEQITELYNAVSDKSFKCLNLECEEYFEFDQRFMEHVDYCNSSEQKFRELFQ